MTLRIIAFGAHPDDCELKAAGVAAKWAAQGHKVKFVATTNGDVGHFAMAGGPLALRRAAEVKRCAETLGIETQVLDIHDGELLPTIENRRTIARLIRQWQADIVLGPRPYDYHPDHRYTGVLMEDSAVLVAAPFFVTDTPPGPKNPIILYYSDNFKKPYPFDPAISVAIEGVPEDGEARKTFIRAWLIDRDAGVANNYRDLLRRRYGDDRGLRIRHAEAFELCQYGSQPTAAELNEMFPM